MRILLRVLFFSGRPIAVSQLAYRLFTPFHPPQNEIKNSSSRAPTRDLLLEYRSSTRGFRVVAWNEDIIACFVLFRPPHPGISCSHTVYLLSDSGAQCP